MPSQAPEVPSPDATPAPQEPAQVTPEEELQEIKLVVLDSAELASRAASLATNAGNDMRQATELMIKTHGKQRKQAMIALISSCMLMLITACVFAAVSITLVSRLNMVDAMLLAVGKRVTELDGTMESVASVNEALQTLAEKQEQAQQVQDKLQERLDEVVKSAKEVPEATAKEVDSKNQSLIKQVQALDQRLQSQAGSLKSISQQVQGLQHQINDSGQRLHSEVETLSRQQRERLNAEAAAKASAVKPKERDPLVQFPRLPMPGASAPRP